MATTTTAVPTADVVVVDWKDLSDPSKDLTTLLEEAYGPSGTGILAIRNLPGFMEAKKELLTTAHSLQGLPEDYLEEELTDAASLYNAGWSHGKEKLGTKPDTAKASYYYNPVTDTPGTPEERAKYPVSYPLNKWPSEDRLPAFKPKAVKVGLLLLQAVQALAVHLDALAAQKTPAYPPRYLQEALKGTEKVKARLLYYFPLKESSDASAPAAEDSWIGWHNDSGFLTALGGDMYVNHETGETIPCPDPAAGLYVVDRQDQVLRVNLPADCCAIQMGECTQIVTNGAVVATPHCVRGAQVPGVARISLPCFVDTPPHFVLESADRQKVLKASVATTRVPPLEDRWTTTEMTFGEFLQATFSKYYSWKQ